jgi:hypothetical protein
LVFEIGMSARHSKERLYQFAKVYPRFPSVLASRADLADAGTEARDVTWTRWLVWPGKDVAECIRHGETPRV